MRSPVIVVVDPGRDLLSGVVQPEEQRLVQEFVAHPPVEAFAEAVLHGLAGGDEMPGDPMLLGPGEHGVLGELRAVAPAEGRQGRGRASGALCHQAAGARRARRP